MDEFAIGATFAEHVIRGVAGRGGMGIVYRAMHVPLKREVALKVIAPGATADEEFRARFRAEFEAAASIQHPNVIPIYHAGEHEGLLFVTMRYVDGDDLARIVAAETRLEPVRAAMLIGQVAAALDAAHARGLVHRDVKPANILIEHSGDLEHALLTDFGLTKSLQSDAKMTKTGTVIGTFDYTAPEQLESGAVDARTDVYALGCVLFQTLTGRVPFPRDSAGGDDVRPLRGGAAVGHRARARGAGGAGPRGRDGHGQGPGGALPVRRRPRPRRAGGGRPAVAVAAACASSRPARARPAGAGRRSRRSSPTTAASRCRASLLSEIESGAFVGRSDALERLRTRYQRAAAGQRQVVLVSGEPGIGKSRLATELAREAHESGRDRALRPQRRRVAGALPAVRDRGPALHGPPPVARAPARARAGAERAGAARARAAPAPARAARAARRGR